jgi:hypothetical protein
LSLGSLLERDREALPILLQIFSTSQYLSDMLVTDSEAYDLLRMTEPQIAHAGIGHPDDWKAILAEELQQVGRIAPVRLGLADDHGANPGGIAHEQRMTLTLDQRVKPLRVAGALDAGCPGQKLHLLVSPELTSPRSPLIR